MNFFSPLQAPADTDGYFIAGYAVFFIVMAVYLAVLVVRNRNLEREYKMLAELDQEAEQS